MGNGEKREGADDSAFFRFDAALEPFLARAQRGRAIEHRYARAATLKQAIEALGVPHTEIGRVVVNGHAATLDRTVRSGDEIEVLPHARGAARYSEPLTFLADSHLGGLARMLRMAGFDTLFDASWDDRHIEERAARERRVVLTRDRELLKRSGVMHGAFVRALKPEAQLRETATRYPLAEKMQPFTLCLHCNVVLDPAAPELVSERVPERIRSHYSRFVHCAGCGRVYWEGSHWARMRSVLGDALGGSELR